MAFAYWPFLSIFKMPSFFEYSSFFGSIKLSAYVWINFVFYDHDSVYFPADIANVSNYGPGMWRLNLIFFMMKIFAIRLKFLFVHMIYLEMPFRLYTTGEIF